MMLAPNESKSFQVLNRGKRSVALALDTVQAQEIAHALAATVDVIVINYRPDVAAKFSIDYDSLRAIKPDLVYVDLTAFGRAGPWSGRPGYDGVVQAATGIMAGEGKWREDGSPATVSCTAIADFSTGMVMADAVIAALFHRERTGAGQLVECSLFATALNIQGPMIMEHATADARRNELRDERHRRRTQGTRIDELGKVRESGMRSGAEIYDRMWLTADGAVAITAESPIEIAAFRTVFGISAALRSESQLTSTVSAESTEETERLAFLISTMTIQEVLDECDAAGIPAAPVHFPAELMDLDQVEANGMIAPVTHEATGAQQVVRTPLEFSDAPLDPSRPSPPLGEHTDSVLATLGYSEEDIQALRSKGVVR